MLILYYSRTGNTRTVAQMLQTAAGGDVAELQTVTPYPEDYRATTAQAKKELADNVYPPLQGPLPDVRAYDVILVGSPNWWGTFAPAVRGFLAQQDFSGKKIAPFITHEGSGLGKSVADLKSLCPHATVLPGLALRGGSVQGAQPDVTRWLQSLGV